MRCPSTGVRSGRVVTCLGVKRNFGNSGRGEDQVLPGGASLPNRSIGVCGKNFQKILEIFGFLGIGSGEGAEWNIFGRALSRCENGRNGSFGAVGKGLPTFRRGRLNLWELAAGPRRWGVGGLFAGDWNRCLINLQSHEIIGPLGSLRINRRTSRAIEKPLRPERKYFHGIAHVRDGSTCNTRERQSGARLNACCLFLHICPSESPRR
jgi:hypothetical protein